MPEVLPQKRLYTPPPPKNKKQNTKKQTNKKTIHRRRTSGASLKKWKQMAQKTPFFARGMQIITTTEHTSQVKLGDAEKCAKSLVGEGVGNRSSRITDGSVNW